MRYNPLKPNKTAKAARPKPLAKGTVPSPEPVSHVPVLSENNVRDGLELRFLSRPDDSTLAAFRATKDLPRDEQWHWHRRGGFWYSRRNDRSRLFATELIARITASLAGVPVPAVPAEGSNQSPAVISPTPLTPLPVQNPVPAVPSNIVHGVDFVPVVDQLAKWRAAMLRRPTPSN